MTQEINITWVEVTFIVAVIPALLTADPYLTVDCELVNAPCSRIRYGSGGTGTHNLVIVRREIVCWLTNNEIYTMSDELYTTLACDSLNICQNSLMKDPLHIQWEMSSV